MSFAKKLARKKAKEAAKAARKVQRSFYSEILTRKKELRKLGHRALYYVTKPQNINPQSTVEDFGEAGLLIY